MSIDKIWVLAEVADGAPITTSLELSPRPGRWPARSRPSPGATPPPRWPPRSATTAPPPSTTSATWPGRCPAPRWPPPSPPRWRPVSGPDAILFPATYDGRDIAGRLSVKLDRPVLTNVVGLTAGGRRSGHPARHLRRQPGAVGPLHRRGPGHLRGPGQVVRGRALRRRGGGRGGRAGTRHRRHQRGQDRGPPRRGAHRPQARRGRRGRLRRAGPRREGAATRSSRSWPRCSTGPPAPAGPSSTPAGSPTRTRSARPARRSSRPSTWPAGSRVPPSTWWA